MGDKSPKSRQKHDKQKKARAAAVSEEKQRVLDLKTAKSDGGAKQA